MRAAIGFDHASPSTPKRGNSVARCSGSGTSRPEDAKAMPSLEPKMFTTTMPNSSWNARTIHGASGALPEATSLRLERSAPASSSRFCSSMFSTAGGAIV